jgi:undecaprenyl-diphosphatase
MTRADLHRSPPMTVRAVRARNRWLLPTAVTVAVVLGVLAAISNGRWLVWDPPITRFFVGLRTPGVDRTALWISRLGSTPVVIAGGLVGVVLAAVRCRTVAAVMLITVAARPPFEWFVKEVVGRPRPSGARLVAGTGFSYPSGHVLAAVATWGFLPVIAGLYITRRWLWWAITSVTWIVIVLVAWSRVWLGVHWTSDVVGALAIGFVAVSIAEVALDRRHEPVAPDNPAESAGRVAATRRWQRGAVSRKDDREAGTACRGYTDGDRAAEAGDDVADDGEAEARTTG